MTNTSAGGHRVVSRDQWLKERIALLAEEKEFTRKRDALASKVRKLPWVISTFDGEDDAVPHLV